MDYQQIWKNGKGVAYAKIYLVFSLLVCFALTSCRTNPAPAISYTAIEHSTEVARITDAVTHYGSTVDAFVADITERTAKVGTSLDELSDLLEEYFTGVGILLQRYKQLQGFIEQRAYLKQAFDENTNYADSLDSSADSS